MTCVEDKVLASGALPDWVLRRIIRSRVRGLLDGLERLGPEEEAGRRRAVLEAFESGAVTVAADDANRQHYEVPPEFFRAVLGPRLKYSSGYWPEGVVDLASAEDAMLALTAERAGLGEGQEILDLGCGWGSLCLWAAERFRDSRIVAVSNSHSQRRFIEGLRDERGLENLEVITAEVGSLEPSRTFDRIVSVEMLEHVRNHRELLRRAAAWLRPQGRLFVHVFCNRRFFYPFEPSGSGDWMSRHFFSGGMMPSWDYLPGYQDDLELLGRWEVDGRHYARTLRAWLENLDQNRAEIIPILEATYGPGRARLWPAYWRVFFMACEETFALDRGREYFVAHYLYGPRGAEAPVQAVR